MARMRDIMCQQIAQSPLVSPWISAWVLEVASVRLGVQKLSDAISTKMISFEYSMPYYAQ